MSKSRITFFIAEAQCTILSFPPQYTETLAYAPVYGYRYPGGDQAAPPRFRGSIAARSQTNLEPCGESARHDKIHRRMAGSFACKLKNGSGSSSEARELRDSCSRNRLVPKLQKPARVLGRNRGQ